MIVFLIGFMGSGKTTIGKALAKQLQWSFVDMDYEIEILSNKTVDALFNEDGEDYFRSLESEWLRSFDSAKTVVSVGGGAPCFNGNIEVMLQKGVVVHLTLPVKMMAQRLQGAKTVRPLLTPFKDDFEALVAFMTELLNKRQPFYRRADITFEVSNMSARKKELLASMVQKVAITKNY